ncbi:MAG: MOSC domain-containing protein [Gaiellaceae bacterium]
MPGRVLAIFVAPSRGEPTRPVEAIEVIAGRGVVGDRHLAAEGAPHTVADLSLVESEAVAAFVEQTGIPLEPGETRRQVVTEGIRLNELVGRRFRVGALECLGVELCEPCEHLEGLTRPGVLRGMVHRAGITANASANGTIAVGDPVAPL